MQLNDPLALRAIDGMIEDATLRLERARHDVELAENAVNVAEALRALAHAIPGLRVVG